MRPSAFSSRIASALVGLTVSRTSSVARGAPSQLTSMRAVVAADDHLVTLDDARRRRRRARCGTPAPRAAPPPRRAPRGRPPARSGARSRPRPRRRGEGPRRGSRRRAARRSASSIRPSVTVPVLSSTIVSTRRVCSRISGPLIRMPICAPRPVPTMSAVGVASPSAQGQAMISTATAAVNAVRCRRRRRRASRRASAARSTITTGTKIAETRSASRCTGAFPDCASSTRRAIWASAVSAPTLVARTTSRP